MTPTYTAREAPWRSRNGLDLPDRVPRAEREAWEARGLCPDADLFTLFRGHALASPGREAVVDARGALSYGELYAEVLRIAALFAEAGLGARDVIALRLPNGRLAVAAELAVYALGAVALPYPLGGGVRDTRTLLSRSRAAGAVLGEPEDLEAAAGLPWLRAVFTASPGAARAGARRLDRAAPAGAFRPSEPPAAARAPARFLVSSGSETEPKLVAYSHQAMAGGRAAYVRALAGAQTGPHRFLVLVPLASSYGSLGVPVTLAALGGTLIVRDRFDAADALRALAEHRPTHVFGVPTMLRRMADLPRRPGEDTGRLRALVSSGAALPASTALACRERFGVPVVTVYGSSDGVNCHTVAPSGDLAGTPDPAVVSLRIVRRDGTPADTGEPGEIQARGPMTPLCYAGAPELDARHRTADGWVRTGDLGALDGAGRLRVLGRIKNVVIRGGHTISPAEVEQELGTDPRIAEAVCVPVPDEEFGERLCACVRPAPGVPAPALAAVTAHLAARGLERRKFPEYLVVLDRMPLRPTGKVCRRTVTSRALAALGADARPGATAHVNPPAGDVTHAGERGRKLRGDADSYAILEQ
ncbi:class I adenylate-forming enzyme family protein [Streptomyces omiyaensis]|uniref:Class I adenylate-forming enzyme family protein n=1 Tax=Streptomyces omiyaensis TaxID=68247 RepID=A0ABW7C1W7_9ACTN